MKNAVNMVQLKVVRLLCVVGTQEIYDKEISF
jgi:hypothetical protein